MTIRRPPFPSLDRKAFGIIDLDSWRSLSRAAHSSGEAPCQLHAVQGEDLIISPGAAVARGRNRGIHGPPGSDPSGSRPEPEHGHCSRASCRRSDNTTGSPARVAGSGITLDLDCPSDGLGRAARVRVRDARLLFKYFAAPEIGFPKSVSNEIGGEQCPAQSSTDRNQELLGTQRRIGSSPFNPPTESGTLRAASVSA